MQLQLLQVAAFMRTFGQPVHLAPVDTITPSELRLRDKLNVEEYDEFLDAFVDDAISDALAVDKVAALDALCDRLYILLGDANTLGLAFLLPAAFRRVHESNMTKLWTTAEMDSALATKTNLTFEFVTKGERCYIARNQIGKVIKSPSYEPANLRDMLDELAGQDILSFDHVHQLVFGDAPETSFEELLLQFGKDDEDEID